MSNYIDEKIIPLKLEHCGNEDVSLKEGYFIDGKLEIFIKKSIIYNDGKSVEYTYNSLRQLSQVKDALGTINIEGDKFCRTTKVVDYSGNEVSYRYGKYGERLKTEYPDGSSVSYEYDKYLRLTSLTSGNKRVDYTYDKECWIGNSW